MLMYYYRGVLPLSSIANVYTFGSPAIFCVESEAQLRQQLQQHAAARGGGGEAHEPAHAKGKHHAARHTHAGEVRRVNVFSPSQFLLTLESAGAGNRERAGCAQ